MATSGTSVKSISGLADKNCHRLKDDVDRIFNYSLTENGLEMSIENAQGAEFILPLIAGELELLRGSIEKKEEIFFLTGGFIANEYTIIPDKDGAIRLIIK
jgi:hypothetical protein